MPHHLRRWSHCLTWSWLTVWLRFPKILHQTRVQKSILHQPDDFIVSVHVHFFSFLLILIKLNWCLLTIPAYLSCADKNNRKRMMFGFGQFFRGHPRPLGVNMVINGQNKRKGTGRRGKIQENKLVSACTVSSSTVLICSNLWGFCVLFEQGKLFTLRFQHWASRKDSLSSQEEEQWALLYNIASGVERTFSSHSWLTYTTQTIPLPLAQIPCSPSKHRMSSDFP